MALASPEQRMPEEGTDINEDVKIDEDLTDQERKRYDDLIQYSRDGTKSLYGNQLYIYSEDNDDHPASKRRREALKRIKARDQYGHLVDRIMSQTHPLARPKTIEPLLNLASTSKTQQMALAIPEETKKTIGQNSIESAAKSARALVLPHIRALDKKNLAMDEMVKPEWHPPWKLYRMISGLGGWVHSLAVDPSNMWFASGSRDGLIKIWDIASGRLRITLTGHISGVRGLAVSDRHPYLFSGGDDKMVKCWDLEQNQVVRHYHGHLSGVYCLALHPTENILITGGRDSVGRVWDMRTKEQICCLQGHTNTLGSILCRDNDPQVVTGSYDTTIRFWDLKAPKTINTLTHHKKSVRTLCPKYDNSSFASGAADNIKQWTLPEGNFVQNLSGHNSIINCLASNKDNVLVSGADNGTLFFWDWRTGYNFQRLTSPVQRGSIESEAGILSMTFDKSGARLITGEADKTIKMYREDLNATEDTHPINWKPNIIKRSRF